MTSNAVSELRATRLSHRTLEDGQPLVPAPGTAHAGSPLVGVPEPPHDLEAEYALEHPVRCNACGATVGSLKAVRLLRTRVNFTSTLPRRGRVLVCPECYAMVPAELTNF